MLPEVITGTLAENFDEISLYNQATDFESGSTSNSNSTSPRVIAWEPASEPSCETIPLHEHFPYDLCNSSKAHAKALATRWAGKEITSENFSDSNLASGYHSDSPYEFNFGSDPLEPDFELNMAKEPLLGRATGLVITSTPAGRFIYWTDRKPTDLTGDNSRCVTYLDTLPFQEGTPLAPNDEQTPTEVVTTDSSPCTLDREVFMEAEDTRTSENRPDRYLDDISEDELSANAPPDKTTNNKNARRDRNRKWNERRKRL
jgi:hypothetical protein